MVVDYLICLLVGVTLPGSSNGVNIYVTVGNIITTYNYYQGLSPSSFCPQAEARRTSEWDTITEAGGGGHMFLYRGQQGMQSASDLGELLTILMPNYW